MQTSKACNTVNEINFISLPCLPFGGSTDDQQNGHKTGEMSAKREKKNDKWEEEMIERKRKKLRGKKKKKNP